MQSLLLSALSIHLSVLFSLQYTVCALFTINIVLSSVYSMMTFFCLVYILCIHTCYVCSMYQSAYVVLKYAICGTCLIKSHYTEMLKGYDS